MRGVWISQWTVCSIKLICPRFWSTGGPAGYRPTIDPEDIEGRINSRTKAIMPVHMLGNPADLDPIAAIARKHGLWLVEDGCEAAGASYRGRRVGSIGDIGGFSLNFYKTITAGDGGLVVTDDEELYWRAFALHDQGHTPNRTGVQVGERSIIGFNFRMNELTGAVALAQVRKIDQITSRAGTAAEGRSRGLTISWSGA